MNILDWIEARLHVRACVCYCSINIGGQTYEAVIEGPDDRHYIKVRYVDNTSVAQTLKIHLANLEPMSDGALFMFSTSEPDYKYGTLIIPPGLMPSKVEEEEDA